jgi:tRNA 2-thiocytidine biosynthesis protein TtcA
LPRPTATSKSVNRTVGRALHRYDMIADRDRILVGVSGGKDSLTLFRALQTRRARIPIDYQLFPVYIDPGFGGSTGAALERLFLDWGVRLLRESTGHGILAHSPENRENPCFLCSRLRRKRLFEIAEALECSKIALGHHKDDIIESLFINIFYAGEISTMMPSQPFFKGKFHVIRPLAFTGEEQIARFAAEAGFPVFANLCPSAKRSKRQEVKGLLKGLYRTNRKIRGNIFRAMSHVNTDYLLK